jgi:hypothetical protein
VGAAALAYAPGRRGAFVARAFAVSPPCASPVLGGAALDEGAV